MTSFVVFRAFACTEAGDGSPDMISDSGSAMPDSPGSLDLGAASADLGGSDSDVLPVPLAIPGESGRVDLNNQPVTAGAASFIMPVTGPARWTAFKVLDYFLRNFVGQKLPCTIWSIIPPRVGCTKLDGPTMMGK